MPVNGRLRQLWVGRQLLAEHGVAGSEGVFSGAAVSAADTGSGVGHAVYILYGAYAPPRVGVLHTAAADEVGIAVAVDVHEVGLYVGGGVGSCMG